MFASYRIRTIFRTYIRGKKVNKENMITNVPREAVKTEDKNKIIEDLKRSLKTQSEKTERYEKALCALLKLSYDIDQDILVDIITNTLKGCELKDQFIKDALTGAVILGIYLKDNS
jgi:hypothetical protein